MPHASRANHYVVLVHDHGYLRQHRKPRLTRDVAEAIKFSTPEAAMKAAMSYLKQTGKERTVEVIPHA